MKMFIYGLLTLVLLGACKEEVEQKAQHTLHLKLNSAPTHALLFGFIGENQIFIDTLKIEKGEVNYPISDLCNDGVYRLKVDGESHEFGYFSENMDLELIEEDGRTTLREKASKGNQIFLDFLGRLTYINATLYGDSTKNYAEAYNQLFKETKEKTAGEYPYLNDLVSFLYQPDYQTYLLAHPTYKDSERSYYMFQYFADHALDSPFLMVTPYYYVSLINFLTMHEQASREEKLEMKKFLLTNAGRLTENQVLIEELIKKNWNL